MAGIIDEYAFAECIALANVNFPQTTIIKNNAFNDCEALVEAGFPKTLSIGNEVFKGCTSLSSLNIPQAVIFGGNVFGNTGNKDISITFGTSTPNFWGNLFNGVSSKTVTLKIPASELKYNLAWKKDFIDGNSNIKLVVEGYTL
jgi:hypothetical protein